MNFSILKKFLARAHFRARSCARQCKIFCINIKNSALARAGACAEMCARRNFFQNRKVHEICYLLCIWNIFISIELIIVDGFEMCAFFEFFQEKFDFFGKFSNFENFRKNRIFEKIFQTSKCSKKFAFWVMIKQKKKM